MCVCVCLCVNVFACVRVWLFVLRLVIMHRRLYTCKLVKLYPRKRVHSDECMHVRIYVLHVFIYTCVDIYHMKEVYSYITCSHNILYI